MHTGPCLEPISSKPRLRSIGLGILFANVTAAVQPSHPSVETRWICESYLIGDQLTYKVSSTKMTNNIMTKAIRRQTNSNNIQNEHLVCSVVDVKYQ